MNYEFNEKDLKKTNALLIQLLKQRDEEIRELRKRVAYLEQQLARYSSPHIPSSKQLFVRKKKKLGKSSGLPPSKRKRRKRGGSKEKKSGMTWSTEPDIVVPRFVEECLHCHNPAPVEFQELSFTKTVVEIPQQIQIQVEEHQIYKYKCSSCSAVTEAGHPTLPGTSLGPNLLTLVATTRYRTGASFESLAELVNDHSKIRPSETALNRGLAQLSIFLEQIADTTAKEVMNSEWLHIDETSHKLIEEGKKLVIGSPGSNGSKKVWVWVFASKHAALYLVDKSRSHKVMKNALEKYRDQNLPALIPVCDCYSSYSKIFGVKQLCWAHLLRDSKELEKCCTDGKILHDGLVMIYEKIKSLLSKFIAKNKDQQATISEKIYQSALSQLHELAEPRSTCEDVARLQKRLTRLGKYYLTVLKYPQIPLTNNFAERLLKTVILHRGNGKSFRSLQAMKHYGTLLTVLTTWKLKGIPIADTLRGLIHHSSSFHKIITKKGG